MYIVLHDCINNLEEINTKKLQKVYNDIEINYHNTLADFYKESQNAAIEEIDITTAINFNRAIFSSNKNMLMAVSDFLLNEKQTDIFNENIEYKI